MYNTYIIILFGHTQKTIPLAPIHSFTKHIVPLLCQESLTRSSLRSFSPVLYMGLTKCYLPSKKFYVRIIFFFVSTYSFSSHTFLWASGSLRDSSLVCLDLSRFLMDFNQTYVSTSPMYICSTCHAIFRLKFTLECIWENYYTAVRYGTVQLQVYTCKTFHAWYHTCFRVWDANICRVNHYLHVTGRATTRGISRVITRHVKNIHAYTRG